MGRPLAAASSPPTPSEFTMREALADCGRFANLGEVGKSSESDMGITHIQDNINSHAQPYGLCRFGFGYSRSRGYGFPY